jgi:hypothetical protein
MRPVRIRRHQPGPAQQPLTGVQEPARLQPPRHQPRRVLPDDPQQVTHRPAPRLSDNQLQNLPGGRLARPTEPRVGDPRLHHHLIAVNLQRPPGHDQLSQQPAAQDMPEGTRLEIRPATVLADRH